MYRDLGLDTHCKAQQSRHLYKKHARNLYLIFNGANLVIFTNDVAMTKISH